MPKGHGRLARAAVALTTAVLLLGVLLPVAQARNTGKPSAKPVFSSAVAFDVSPPLSQLARDRIAPDDIDFEADEEIDAPQDHGFSGDSVVQSTCRAEHRDARVPTSRGSATGQLQHLRLPCEPAGSGG